MRNRIHHVSGVVVDPHGLASRNGDTGTGGVLDRDGVRAVVLDDVRLLDGRHDEVPGSARCASAAQAHVTCRLGSVGVGERQRDIAAGEGDIRRASDSLLDGDTKVVVRDVTPRGVVLTRGHQLDFEVAVSARHFRPLRRYFYPNYRITIVHQCPRTGLRVVHRLPIRRLVVVDDPPDIYARYATDGLYTRWVYTSCTTYGNGTDFAGSRDTGYEDALEYADSHRTQQRIGAYASSGNPCSGVYGW